MNVQTLSTTAQVVDPTANLVKLTLVENSDPVAARSTKRKRSPKKSSDEAVLVGPAWINLTFLRMSKNESQFIFWDRFGVTQSAGSRYESDPRRMPSHLAMLMIAFATGMVDETKLQKLRLSAGRLAEIGQATEGENNEQ